MIFPGAEPVVSVGEAAVAVFEESDEPVASVIDGLELGLAAQGWVEVSDVPIPGGSSMVSIMPGWECTYDIVAGSAASTEVWTRCSVVAATAD